MADQLKQTVELPTPSEMKELLPYCRPSEIALLKTLLTKNNKMWTPLPGPQAEAYYSKADIVGYGGAAGGGKTDLVCGLTLNEHQRTITFRREGTQLTGIESRMEELVGHTDGYNSTKKVWKLMSPDGVRREIQFAGVPHIKDVKRFQGNPHDLINFDEVTEFLEAMVRFLMGWNRTADEGQRCRVLMTFNPPTTAEGRWVISFFAPWLDPKHPNPAEPGELRWFTTIAGKDVECDGPDPIEVDGEMVYPKSRTFIPAKVEDNLYYMKTGYKAQLQALPEPLRSQMLKGDFMAGVKDDEWQVIPTAWLDAAMERWHERPKPKRGIMDSMGVDVGRGGDKSVITERFGNWFDRQRVYPGTEAKTGPEVAAKVVMHRKDRAPVHVDVIGVGSSVYDFLVENEVQTLAINNSAPSAAMTKNNKLKFRNIRAEVFWKLREALDPDTGENLQIPPDPELTRDLCAARWKLTPNGIQIESKEEIKERIGHSPDKGDSFLLATITTMKDEELPWNDTDDAEVDYDPYE